MRARWVETARGEFAIVLRVAGAAALIRYAAGRGGYTWTAVDRLTRRRDLDAQPEPAWLQQARVSPRPDPALWWLLDRVPAPPDTLAPPTDAADDTPTDHPPFMFDTDADGRPLS